MNGFYSSSGGLVNKWYLNGKLHRVDGPALIVYETNKINILEVMYFIDGYKLSKSNWEIRRLESKWQIQNNLATLLS